MSDIRLSAEQLNHRYRGIRGLYGDENFAKLQSKHVCAIGCGGVGSWGIECLARTGVGHITIIDHDTVDDTNCNRQVPALNSTIGQYKADVLAARLRDINPNIVVETKKILLTKENISQEVPWNADVFIDAIDDIDAKSAIVDYALKNGKNMITAGGAAGKTNPSLVKSADLVQATHDHLLRKLRTVLRKEYGYSKLKKKYHIPVIYCAQEPHISDRSLNDVPIYGASMCVTAVVGLNIAAWVLNKLQEQ